MRKVWMHVIINARCSWLHGDARGFRNRGHRIHSSGDYKHPPPKGEHAGLWRYHKSRAGEAVAFDEYLRIRITRQFVLKMLALERRVIACSVGEKHLHVLVELADAYETMKREVGKCKQKVSHSLRDECRGTIWAAGGEFKRINDLDHLNNSYNYIRTRQEPGAVVWSHNEDEDWIDNPKLGAIIMAPDQTHIRAFRPDAGV